MEVLRLLPSVPKMDQFPLNLSPHIRGKLVWSRPLGATMHGPVSNFHVELDGVAEWVAVSTPTSLPLPDPRLRIMAGCHPSYHGNIHTVLDRTTESQVLHLVGTMDAKNRLNIFF